jgi:hypothetical protein
MQKPIGNPGSQTTQPFPATGDSESFSSWFKQRCISVGHAPPETPASWLYVDRKVNFVPRKGFAVPELWRRYQDFLADFFAYPENFEQLSLLLRHFLSRYAGSGVLAGIDEKWLADLKDLENAILDLSGGPHARHARITEHLILLYNATLKKVFAGSFEKIKPAANGSCLLPVETPQALQKALLEEEIAFARSGKVWCLDAKASICYVREYWSNQEWRDAVKHIRVNSTQSELDKVRWMKKPDTFYFPHSVPRLYAFSYNLLSELRWEAYRCCKKAEKFDLRIFSLKLRESGQDSQGWHVEGRGPGISSRPSRKIAPGKESAGSEIVMEDMGWEDESQPEDNVAAVVPEASPQTASAPKGDGIILVPWPAPVAEATEASGPRVAPPSPKISLSDRISRFSRLVRTASSPALVAAFAVFVGLVATGALYLLFHISRTIWICGNYDQMSFPFSLICWYYYMVFKVISGLWFIVWNGIIWGVLGLLWGLRLTGMPNLDFILSVALCGGYTLVLVGAGLVLRNWIERHYDDALVSVFVSIVFVLPAAVGWAFTLIGWLLLS